MDVETAWGTWGGLSLVFIALMRGFPGVRRWQRRFTDSYLRRALTGEQPLAEMVAWGLALVASVGWMVALVGMPPHSLRALGVMGLGVMLLVALVNAGRRAGLGPGGLLCLGGTLGAAGVGLLDLGIRVWQTLPWGTLTW